MVADVVVDVEIPDGMVMERCDWPGYEDTYLLRPRVWLVRHVDLYYMAMAQAGQDRLEDGRVVEGTRNRLVQQLAGVLALVENGEIEVHNVPGVPANPHEWDLRELPAQLMGWLRTAVASSIEATQLPPFLSRARSARGGTT